MPEPFSLEAMGVREYFLWRVEVEKTLLEIRLWLAEQGGYPVTFR